MKIKNRIQIIILLLIILILNNYCQKEKLVFIHNNKLYIEIVNNDEKRSKGLMFRKELPNDKGMLFVFENSQFVNFWMKNTFIPLSIAFIDSNYNITQIEDMSPLDEESSHASIRKIKYALEVNQGWFAKNNIKIGDKIQGLE